MKAQIRGNNCRGFTFVEWSEIMTTKVKSTKPTDVSLGSASLLDIQAMLRDTTGPRGSFSVREGGGNINWNIASSKEQGKTRAVGSLYLNVSKYKSLPDYKSWVEVLNCAVEIIKGSMEKDNLHASEAPRGGNKLLARLTHSGGSIKAFVDKVVQLYYSEKGGLYGEGVCEKVTTGEVLVISTEGSMGRVADAQESAVVDAFEKLGAKYGEKFYSVNGAKIRPQGNAHWKEDVR